MRGFLAGETLAPILPLPVRNVLRLRRSGCLGEVERGLGCPDVYFACHGYPYIWSGRQGATLASRALDASHYTNPACPVKEFFGNRKASREIFLEILGKVEC